MPIVSVNGIADDFTPVGISQLGTIVFDNILFPAGRWFDLQGNPQLYNEVKLDAVAITVNRVKNIVISTVAGKSGTIKEYITNSDYTIDVSAILAPETYSAAELAQIVAGLNPFTKLTAGLIGFEANREPTELLRNIKLLDDVQDRVPVRCKFLQNVYNIDHVVIEDATVEKSTADTYILRLRMLSDPGIDLGDFG